MPAEAAVGDVLLFFSVLVGISTTRSTSMPNSSATSCRIFTFTPWPISVRAGRDLHRAVGVDVDQRVALVEELRRERDAELHAGHRQAADVRARRRVEPGDFVAPLAVLRSGGQRREDFRQMVAVEQLAVGRDVALADAVQVAHPHVEGVEAQVLGDRLQNVLDHGHRLRAAEAAEGRVRRQVREAHLAGELDVRQEVAVVGVQQRPLHHGQRQVGRAAAVGVVRDAQRVDAAVVVEADFPLAAVRRAACR